MINWFMQTKRVLELKVGDIFTYMNIQRIVVRMENGVIYYRHFGQQKHGMSEASTFGCNCQQRVEFHFNKGEKK